MLYHQAQLSNLQFSEKFPDRHEAGFCRIIALSGLSFWKIPLSPARENILAQDSGEHFYHNSLRNFARLQGWGSYGPREHLIWPASEFSLLVLQYNIVSKRSSMISRYLDSTMWEVTFSCWWIGQTIKRSGQTCTLDKRRLRRFGLALFFGWRQNWSGS